MAKRKNKKLKAKNLKGISDKILQKGEKAPKLTFTAKREKALSTASKKAMDDSKKTIEIERYAKDNGISITQAMIHFMG